MITILFLTLAVIIGISNGYRDPKKSFNPTVSVNTCNRNKIVVHLENAGEEGIIYISGDGSGCKHKTSTDSHDYEFHFDTCKVDLSKMFRLVVQQLSYAQTTSDKTVQVICAVDVVDFNSEDNGQSTSHKESKSVADGQHTSQPSNTDIIDHSKSEGIEANTSTDYEQSQVSPDEVGDSLSTWFKAAMNVHHDHPAYTNNLIPESWNHKATPVTITTPTVQNAFITTKSTETRSSPTTKAATKSTTTTKNTDVTTPATTKMSLIMNDVPATPSTTKPETISLITSSTSPMTSSTSPMTSSTLITTTSPTNVVGYKPSVSSTTYDSPTKIPYDVLLKNNKYQKTLLMIADFLLQRDCPHSLHSPVQKKKSSSLNLLYQTIHQYNLKENNRPFQLNHNHHQTTTLNQILKLLKKGQARTSTFSSNKDQTHRAKGHVSTLPLFQRHFQQRGNLQFNLKTLQRLQEHFGIKRHTAGHHQKLMNNQKHSTSHNKEHANKHDHGPGHHQEHITNRKHVIGHHPINKHAYEMEDNGKGKEKKVGHIFEKSKGGTIHNQTRAQAGYLLANGLKNFALKSDSSILKSKHVQRVNTGGKTELLKQLMHLFHGH